MFHVHLRRLCILLVAKRNDFQKIPLLGGPEASHPTSCYKSLLSNTAFCNHIKGNGQIPHLLVGITGREWLLSYIPLGPGVPKRVGGWHRGWPSHEWKDLAGPRSVGYYWEVAGSMSKGWHYWTLYYGSDRLGKRVRRHNENKTIK